MESITNRSSPTLGMSATNTSPSRNRSFRITSPWSEFHSNKSSNSSSKAQGKDGDGKQISIFATVVEVSRSKTGSLRSKIGSLRTKDSRIRVVRPDIFENSTFDATKQRLSPPNRSNSAPPAPRINERILPPNRSNSAPPISSTWQHVPSPDRSTFTPPIDTIKEHVSFPDRSASTLPIDIPRKQLPPLDRGNSVLPDDIIEEHVPFPNAGPSVLPTDNTKNQALPPVPEFPVPPIPQLARKNSLRERTQTRLAGIKQKLFRSSSPRKLSKSLPEICSELAQIPTEEVSNPQTAKCRIFKEEPIMLEVKSLGKKKFKMLLPVSQGSSAPGIGEDDEEDGSSCDRFIEMLPESCQTISQKASPLGLVPKLFPYGKIGRGARYVASCFWIWLCMVDDLTENLVGQDWKFVESDLIQVFTDNNVGGLYNNEASDVIKVSLALRSVIDTTDIHPNSSHAAESAWRHNFRSAVREVLAGFQAERPLLESKKIALSDWMRVRMVTISARPFMILAKASLGLEPVLSPFGNPLSEDYIPVSPDHRGGDNNVAKVECLLQLIMGLQNDILGWERDIKTCNTLNTIQILTKGGMKPSAAMKDVIGMHNELIQHLSDYGERAWIESLHSANPPLADVSDFLAPPTMPFGNASLFGASSITLWPDFRGGLGSDERRMSMPDDNIRKYLEIATGFANGMANWMMVSKRYAVDNHGHTA